MTNRSETLADLEKQFWQSMVDGDTQASLKLLAEPAVMVTPHGALKFDHEGYRKMAEQGSMLVTAFDLSEMVVVFPNETTAVLTYRVKQSVATRGNGKTSVQHMNDTSTWVQAGQHWKCVLHTETPAEHA